MYLQPVTASMMGGECCRAKAQEPFCFGQFKGEASWAHDMSIKSYVGLLLFAQTRSARYVPVMGIRIMKFDLRSVVRGWRSHWHVKRLG